jgi:hypothetical protein
VMPWLGYQRNTGGVGVSVWIRELMEAMQLWIRWVRGEERLRGGGKCAGAGGHEVMRRGHWRPGRRRVTALNSATLDLAT